MGEVTDEAHMISLGGRGRCESAVTSSPLAHTMIIATIAFLLVPSPPSLEAGSGGNSRGCPSRSLLGAIEAGENPGAIEREQNGLARNLRLTQVERLSSSQSVAVWLAKKNHYRQALSYVGDCLDLLGSREDEASSGEVRIFLEVPILFAWRQERAPEAPADAVALDRLIALSLLRVVLIASTNKDANHLLPVVRQTAAGWLAGRVVEYGLKGDSPCPRAFGALLTSAYCSSSSDLAEQKAIALDLGRIMGMPRPGSPPPAGGAGAALKEDPVAEANRLFLAELLTQRGLHYLDKTAPDLCRRRLGKPYETVVGDANGPTVGQVLVGLAQHTEKCVGIIMETQSAVARATAAAEAEKRTAAALRDHASSVKRGNLPALPKDLPPEAVAALADERKTLEDKKAARGRLRDHVRAIERWFEKADAAFDRQIRQAISDIEATSP